ncbi:hypothetical protein BH10ACI3_BH10ACI3_11650 [soil metagenome]
MKLATKAYVITLILLMLVFAASGQQRSEKDDRNTAPTVGTGGAVGGPTGLFTVLDGQTLRKGEYTLSVALSNYDRDPGNVDITSVPLSFQVGVSNKLELFFTTEGYRGIKVNSPRNLSGFYLPNSQVNIGGFLRSAPAIVLAPQGSNTSLYPGTAVYRPTGMPFTQFPYTNGNAGTYNLQFPYFSGNVFGFNNNANATLGPPRVGGAADLFPGVGSVYGGILPGIVLSSTTLLSPTGAAAGEGPVVFTTAPTYIADAPFINRTWGTSAFNTMDFGFKWRFNNVESPVGFGVSAFYRWNLDTADSLSGFNMLQRGAGGGGNRGDVGVTAFADARVAKWANVSANVGYLYTTAARGNFGGTEYTLLDRPDELTASVGVDFPVNRHFQPMLEFRSLTYVGGRTPNALERNPIDGLAGFRWFWKRWVGMSFAYRYNFNQQDAGSFDDSSHSTAITLPCRVGQTNCSPTVITNTFKGTPQGFVPSTDPNGYIAQFFIGRRDARRGDIVNQVANVDSVNLNMTVITLPCAPGFKSKSGACNDTGKTIEVATKASDPENDVLTYNYTVSGGRINGTGANVQWDLSSAQPGTYTITTGVDDGCGVCGKTNTQTIKVQECPDCVKVCDCATLSVSGPTGITNPGDTMTFTAVTSGDVTYNWMVSAGTIESGQGTASIVVRTTKDMAGSNVTATVELGGLTPDCNCPSNASETAGVAERPNSNITDEFGNAPNDDVKARVDNFYIQLNANPSAKGYIINYGTPAQIKSRKAQIDKAITFRKYDKSRVNYIDGPDSGAGINTKFILVPEGADVPRP